MDDSINKVLAELRFGIVGAEKDLEIIEQRAKKAALTVQETFAKTQLTSGGMNTQAMTAQAAMINRITAEGEASKAAIVAQGEAKISTEMAREELVRQKIVKESAAVQLATVRKQVEQEKLLYMQARKAAFEEKPTGFAGLMERRTSWLLTGGLVMGGLAGIYETASTIKDVEMGMTTIARVTEDAAFNFKGMRDELQQLGVTYGDTWENVSDIAIRWAQAGYDMSETLELTKDSLLALNTAELNSEQATNGLIAVMSQWGLTSEELLPTIDKINKVADDFAITSTDLVAGLQRSSGAAKVLGLTMNETIAILTTMREATGRTGKEVGNALNSILSFMQRDKAIGTFEDMGIQVFADDARTQFRNVIEIFDEMAAKWPQMGNAARDILTSEAEAAGLFSEEMSEAIGMQGQWNDMQQRDLSQAAAGVYRRNYLLALLQNWSKVDEVLISQENSLGYSMAENERTMQTLEKQIEVLKASAEQLAVALGDAGLLNELTGLVEGITDAVQWFNNLDDSMQTALLTVAEMTIAVKLLAGAAKTFGIAAGAGKALEMAKGVTSLAGATALASTAAKGLGRGLMGALGGPWGVAAITIGSAIGFIARETNKANDELQEHATMASGLIKEYDSLTSKMDGMAKGTDEYNEAAKQLNVLKGNIADSLPSVINGWDKETNSIQINREAMQDMIDAGEELKKTKAENNDATDAEIKRLEEVQKAYQTEVQQYESSQGVLKDLSERREELIGVLAKQKEGSEEAKTTQEALGETERLIADIAQEAGLKRNATVDAIMSKLKELSAASKQMALDNQYDQAKMTQDTINETIKRLNVLSQEIAAKQALSPGGKNYEYLPGFLKGKYNFLPGGEGWTRKGLSNKQEEFNKANKELVAAQQKEAEQLRKIQDAQNEINKIKAGEITGGGSTGDGSAGSGSGKSSDWLSAFLDQTLAIAEAQARLNDASQRGIDILAAKRGLYVDNAMTMGEYVNGLKEQNSATALLEQHQAGLHAEADAYRAAITALEAKQKTLNTSTDEGREAYNKIGDEIDNARQKVDELGQSWLSDEAAQRSIPTEKFREMSEWVEKLVNMGAINLEQQLAIYDAVDETKLTYAEQVNLMEKQVDLGKQLLKQAVDKKIAEIEAENDAFKKASDAKIDAIQAELDLMDEQTEQLEEQKQIQESQADMAKARQNLANAQSKLGNVQGEKNTRIFQSGTWDYIADPQAVKDAQDEVEDAQDALIDAQNSFNDTMASIQQAQYRKELEAQIQAEKEKQKVNKEAGDEAKAQYKRFLEEVLAGQLVWGENMDADLKTIMDTLNISMDGKLLNILQTVQLYAGQMRSEFASIVEAAGEAGVNLTGGNNTNSATGEKVKGSKDTGGPINETGLYLNHEGEYMLNAPTVNALGGQRGVENLLASLRFPKPISANSIVRTNTNISSPTVDKSVNLNGPISFPQVVDGSGLIRNLKQIAQS